MRIGLICSSAAYGRIPEIARELTAMGHTPVMPNCYDDPVGHDDTEQMDEQTYLSFFRAMYLQSRDRTGEVDAVLALNYPKEKNGQVQENYVGASTFLELYEAFMQGKKIFLLFGLPDSMLLDEIRGFGPVLLNGDLSGIG